MGKEHTSAISGECLYKKTDEPEICEEIEYLRKHTFDMYGAPNFTELMDFLKTNQMGYVLTKKLTTENRINKNKKAKAKPLSVMELQYSIVFQDDDEAAIFKLRFPDAQVLTDKILLFTGDGPFSI